MNVFLPIWKADLMLLRNLCYEHKPGEQPLSCPIDVFCGHGEDLDIINYLDDWNQLTTATVTKHFMAGDHFFLNDKTNTKKVQSFIEMKIEEKQRTISAAHLANKLMIAAGAYLNPIDRLVYTRVVPKSHMASLTQH
ncbi:gramicidin dehydrogenase [Elysia marginata]|uniref:Gramicidin dehydrogenase n=1 Tax=Elysia marginata TaxID=1093978 RepID=A0AAV4FF20_9GAST|nr:gramicidin dehydrogenase [Elysia marginata]